MLLKFSSAKFSCPYIAIVILYLFSSGACAVTTVENKDIALSFDLRAGVSITRIHDKINNFEYLTAPSPFFAYAVNRGYAYNSNTNNTAHAAGVIVDSQTLSADHRTLTITCHEANAGILSFKIIIRTPAGAKAAIVTTTVHNTGSASVFLKMLTPGISNLTCPGYSADSSRMLGMIPQEIGTVSTLAGSNIVIGRPGIEKTSQLPGAMNVMEVADIYDRNGGGGVFFADLDGNASNNIAPVEFQAAAGSIKGNWAQSLAAGATVTLPQFAIGVHHSGDYHEAIDYYVAAHASKWSYPATPSWLKEAGAIWSTGEEGSGGPYQIWPEKLDLKKQIATFDSLPVLYKQAAAQGTNVFYLNDYWEGDGSAKPRYLFKGDYIPRADLGGEAALKRGIAAIHAKGGKVIMYLEPFIITKGTNVARAHGRAWAARDAGGEFWMPYAGNYTMMANEPAWQSYVTNVAKRLVGYYGADGVFLDSWGERWNLCYKDSVTNVIPTAVQWNKGVLDMADSVLKGIRTIKPDAVVLSETLSGELNRHESGGLSADFVWDYFSTQGRLVASPVRYGIPQANYFSNGNSLNQAAQVYASGHSLALNSRWNENSAFLKQLLDIRRFYKDALVYGTQAYQPSTGILRVAAYFYRGTKNKVITLVNCDSTAHTITLSLKPTGANSLWTDALTGKVYRAHGTKINIAMPASTGANNGLRVLVETGGKTALF